jgi:hypothetical protein
MLAGLGHLCYVRTMKAPHLLAVGAAVAAMLFAASGAEAQQRPIGGGPRNSLPADGGMHGRDRFVLPVVWVEQQDPVIIEKTVVKEVPVAAEPKPPPPPPREPYAIGKSYDTLPPQGCMKMIEDGASYYLCSGEWYRQVGGKYEAVKQP